MAKSEVPLKRCWSATEPQTVYWFGRGPPPPIVLPAAQEHVLRFGACWGPRDVVQMLRLLMRSAVDECGRWAAEVALLYHEKRPSTVAGGPEVSQMAMPKAKWKAGAVEAAIWENEINVGGQVKTILKASVSRRYKDQSGTWKSSSSFSRNEIALAVYCLGKAFEWIIEEGKEGEESLAEEVIE